MSKRQMLFIKAGSLAAFLVLAGCGGADDSAPPTANHAAQSTAAAASASHAQGPQFAEYEDAAGLSAMRKVGVCSLENVVSASNGSQSPGDVANSYKVGKNGSYKLIGFATDKEAGRVPGKIKLVLAGAKTFSLDAATGRERPDVANFFKIPALHDAGYQVDASFDQMPAGSYSVSVLEVGSKTICPTHQTLTVE